ncbi:MAG: hypothetical protein ACK5Z4_05850, partial [Planctomyces sp.]
PPASRVAPAGHSPPYLRAQARQPDFVATLVKAGADVDAKDRRGWTASQWANNRGDDFGREVVATLRGNASVPAAPAPAPAPAPATPVSPTPPAQ